MSIQPQSHRRRPAARRRTWPRVVGAMVLAVVLLLLGVAIGKALADRPSPGGVQTIVRTLEPLPQQAP
jgi:hypothetical protein